MAAKLSKHRTFVQKCIAVTDNLTAEAEEILRESPQGKSLEITYVVATVDAADQPKLAMQIVDSRLSKREAQQLATDVKEAQRTPRKRPARSKPFEKSFKGSNGLTFIVKARRAAVSDGDMVASLRELADSIDALRASKAA